MKFEGASALGIVELNGSFQRESSLLSCVLWLDSNCCLIAGASGPNADVKNPGFLFFFVLVFDLMLPTTNPVYLVITDDEFDDTSVEGCDLLGYLDFEVSLLRTAGANGPSAVVKKPGFLFILTFIFNLVSASSTNVSSFLLSDRFADFIMFEDGYALLYVDREGNFSRSVVSANESIFVVGSEVSRTGMDGWARLGDDDIVVDVVLVAFTFLYIVVARRDSDSCTTIDNIPSITEIARS
jgi:hypothetical protein